MSKNKPIDEVKEQYRRLCPYVIMQRLRANYRCSLVGNKLEGSNDEFYYAYSGDKPCTNKDWIFCPLRGQI